MATLIETRENGFSTASPPAIGPDLNDASLADIIKEEPISMANTNRRTIAPQIDPASAPAMVTPLGRLGLVPAWIDCPHCQRMTETTVRDDLKIERTSGIVTCLVCLVCCPLVFCLPTTETHSYIHTCSKCSATVAIKEPDGNVRIIGPMQPELGPSKYGSRGDQLEETKVT